MGREIVGPSLTRSASRARAVNPSFECDFWKLVGRHSLDMAKPAELLASDPVHDGAGTTE